MSDVFTASNGVDVTVTAGPDETYLLGKGGVIKGGDRRWTVCTGNSEGIVALREFFDHEAGRWRSPEHPEWVVYRVPGEDDSEGRCVLVVNERTGENCRLWDSHSTDEVSELSPEYYKVGCAWFLAHSEKKPWHDAKPGEVWALTFSEEGGGGTEAWAVDAHGCFGNPSYAGHVRIQDSTITAARRIWPEVSDG